MLIYSGYPLCCLALQEVSRVFMLLVFSQLYLKEAMFNVLEPRAQSPEPEDEWGKSGVRRPG